PPDLATITPRGPETSARKVVAMSLFRLPRTARVILWMTVSLMATRSAGAQTDDPRTSPEATTIFSHDGSNAWWLSGQINLIGQWHGGFRSTYEGPKSVRPTPEHAVSHLW